MGRRCAARSWPAAPRSRPIEPAPGLPDLVFTANAAVVLDGKALLARFHHAERRGEQPVFAAGFAALRARGLIDEVVEMPEGVALEGAGDCIFDRHRGLFWMGCGFRSDEAAAPRGRSRASACRASRCSSPIRASITSTPRSARCRAAASYTIRARSRRRRSTRSTAALRPTQRIALDRADAARFAANAVCFGGVIVLSSCSVALRRTLEDRGYAVVKTPLHAFLRSGGSACCLTLRLDHRRAAARAEPIAPAARAAAVRLR